MGFFKWLFGKREEQADERESGFFNPGPAEPPKLPAELEPYVIELHDLYYRENTFDGLARDEARTIGERIHSAHGFDGMVLIRDTVRFSFSGHAGRELEMVWDGVGEWSD